MTTPRKKAKSRKATQADPQTVVEFVASLPSTREVHSWERKGVTLAKLLQELEPYQQQILDILKQKQPLVDEIEQLRAQMVQECIHPIEHLVQRSENEAVCKFCERLLVIPSPKESDDTI